MTQWIHLSLCLAVFACPLNCLGLLTTEIAHTPPSSTCSCCSHVPLEQENSPPLSPESPTDHSSCYSCFCGGALSTSDKVANSEIAHGELPVCDALALARHVGVLLPKASHQYLPQHSVALHRQSGRFVRILYESFLL